MVNLSGTSLNQLFETLADWETVLQGISKVFKQSSVSASSLSPEL